VTFVVVTGLPEQTGDLVLPELMAIRAPMELLVDAVPTAHRVLKARPGAEGAQGRPEGR
jgi:hypothetical protein